MQVSHLILPLLHDLEIILSHVRMYTTYIMTSLKKLDSPANDCVLLLKISAVYWGKSKSPDVPMYGWEGVGWWWCECTSHGVLWARGWQTVGGGW